MAEVASQTVDLVGREVSATLAEARGALESYVEQPDNAQLLETCAQQLHQVQGVLRLLEIYGAALRRSGAGRAAAARDLRRGAPRRGDGARRPVPAGDARRAQEPGGKSRCADARHGAAAELSRARARRGPRSGAGAAAAAERPARRAR